MITTRAKFVCQSIEEWAGGQRKVKLSVVYQPRPDGSENHGFTKATPAGTIEMQVDNPAAAVQFQPGKAYYVDFSPAES